MAVIRVLLYGKEVNAVPMEAGRSYVFGRGEDCDVVLEERPGISRQHFKVSEANGQWVAQVISKFGDLIVAGQSSAQVDLTHGAVFRINDYQFKFDEHDDVALPAAAGAEGLSQASPATGRGGTHFDAANESAQDDLDSGHESAEMISRPPVVRSPRSQVTLSVVPQGAESGSPAAPIDFEGNEDATAVGQVAMIRPSLRIVKSGEPETRIELDGRKWIAGREETCEIFLADRKASRRQFEINSTPEGYFITDLGSANGTVLNGEALVPNQPQLLQSGDIISVQSLIIHFELRDPGFEKRLVNINPEVLAPPSVPPAPRFEIINYPGPVGNGGAVRVDPMGGSPWDQARDVAEAEKKKKNLRIILIAVVIAVIAIVFLQDDAPKNTAPVRQDAFTLLPEAKQKEVKDLYAIAHNLFIQGKVEGAFVELEKLHKIIPDGYKNSRVMMEEVIKQRETAERLRLQEEERRQVEEQNRIIARNIEDCSKLASTTFSVDEIRSCLSAAIERDPSNGSIQDLIARVQKRAADKATKDEETRVYNEKVSKGRVMHQDAVRLHRQENWFGALDAYEAHIKSEWPDPNRLKARSKRGIADIRRFLDSKVDEMLVAAEAAWNAKNYRDAIIAAQAAKNFDPTSMKAAEFLGKARRELNSILKVEYETAVLYEGVGRLEEAIRTWKTIEEKDTPEGEYGRKSRSKLRNYSDPTKK
jgi:pSer/pThr/pTyr-binding forkhead associated (FHA) protein/tetratricopeptide (TPR) repeat protein